MRCASCQTENPEGTKFCGQCGTPLVSMASGATTSAGKAAAPEGERRTVTVVFADVSGFTTWASASTPRPSAVS